MIDLHSHILPGIDDGAQALSESLAMARLAVDSGTKIIACTPHIRLPIYPNTAQTISAAVEELKRELIKAEINLELVVGADIHMAADMIEGLEDGRLPTLNGTRYFLFEPSHDVVAPGIVGFCSKILSCGFVPVLTHPERLSWIERSYDVICKLQELGLVVQLTAGSLTGNFGPNIQQWSRRMLDEGRVDIVASDAHNMRRRNTSLAEVRDWLAIHYGDKHAELLLQENPARILRDEPIVTRSPEPATVAPQKKGILKAIKRLVGR